jgi:hypothetical protein
VYDRCAHTLRIARAKRVPIDDLLALALPASWTVNSRAASPVFQRWLQPAAREAWTALVGALAGGVGPWLGFDAAHRDRVSFLAGALVAAGGDLCSLSKVLALLVPEGVPLMDDGALWMLLDAVPRPATADAPTGGVGQLLPMLDAFATASLTHEDTLIALARGHTTAVLDAPQQKAPTEENAPSEGRDKPAPTPEAPYVAIDAVMRESLQAGAVRHETSLSIDAMQRNKKPDAEDDPSNDIRPGMLLSLRFVATDNFGPGEPHVARSEAFTFRVVTRDKLVDELRRRQVEQRLEVQKMRDDVAAAQLMLRETLSPKADDPRAAQARLQFKQLAARQQSLGRRIALASDLYQRILWEYENNRVWEPSKVREYEALTAVPLADLGKAAFPRTAQEVATFADTGDEELRASALSGYDEILRRLDAILRVMEQVETLAALIEQLRGVIKVEDSAIRDVENKLKAAGESLFQKPGKQK